jgi:hypothetical protein
MNQQDTANEYLSWDPGMAVTLSLFKKMPTPPGATQDPYDEAVVLTACRRRGLTSSMMMIYASVIGFGKSRLFEVWPGADGQPPGIISNGDVLQDDSGARWTVKDTPETIFDNCTLALCVPEN